MPDAESKSSEKNKRKLTWAERCGILGAICALLGALINGPIARYSAGKAIERILPKLGMTGSYHVDGSISGGFSLSDVDLKGDRGLASIKAKNLILEYKLNELIEGKVRGLNGKDINLVFAVDEFPKSKKRLQLTENELKEYRKTALSRVLKRVRSILIKPKIDIETIESSLTRKGKTFLHFSAHGLLHDASSNIFELKQFQTTSFSDKSTPIQDIRLNWLEEYAYIKDAHLLPNVFLKDLRIHHKENTPSFFATDARIFETDVKVNWTPRDFFKAVTYGKPLNLKETVSIWDPEIPISGTLNSATVDLTNYKKPIHEWIADVAVNVDNFSFSSTKLPDIRSVIEFRSGDVYHRSLITDGTNNARLVAKSDFSQVGKWRQPKWWEGMLHQIQLEANNIHFPLTAFAKIESTTLTKIPNTHALFQGELISGSSWGVQSTDLNYTLKSITVPDGKIPSIEGAITFKNKAISLEARPSELNDDETFTFNGGFDFKKSAYTGTLVLDLKTPDKLNQYIQAYQIDLPVTKGPSLTWKASGDLKEKRHNGEIEGLTFTFQKEEAPPVEASITGNYSWPDQVTIKSLNLSSIESRMKAEAVWKNPTLSVEELQFFDKEGIALTAEGTIPLPSAVTTEEELMGINESIGFSLSAEDLSLERIIDLLPIQRKGGISASITSSLDIKGTYKAPQLEGSFNINELRFPTDKELPALNIESDVSTEDETLYIEGRGFAKGAKILDISGNIGFQPRLWLKKEALITEEPLYLEIQSKDFPLLEVEGIFPTLSKIDGSANAKLVLTETIKEPSINGELILAINKLGIKNEYFSTLEETSITLQFDGKDVTIPKSIANSSGGRFELSGTVGLEDIQNPNLDINLLADKALVYRDSSITLRADGTLNLKGPIESAALTGNIGFVEGIFYKDIEIIPFGIPRKTVPKPELPSTPSFLSRGELPIPDKIANWKLSLNLALKDPLLIRGNIARGKVVGSMDARGTLKKPRLQGDLSIRDLMAELPFSRLEVKNGRISMSPNSLVPKLDIKGTSKTGQYDATILVYGSTEKPQLAVSSNPPLPENEVYTLLATGTTTSDLSEDNIVSAKAFQLLIRELQGRAKRNKNSKTVRKLAKMLDNFELNAGDRQSLSGRVFSSATVRLHDRWFVSASVDRDGDSRGLLIFSLRFH